jgi:xanthine dehydrogenase accessory factor
VCGMTVVVGPSTRHLAIDGRDHWFCGPACEAAFTATREHDR